MARLGELLKSSIKVDQVKVKDVVWHPDDQYFLIKICEAKTATVGEIQDTHCQNQSSLLDPVGAVSRLIAGTGATEDNNLFSYPSNGKRITLTKAQAMRLFDDAWRDRTGGETYGSFVSSGWRFITVECRCPD